MGLQPLTIGDNDPTTIAIGPNLLPSSQSVRMSRVRLDRMRALAIHMPDWEGPKSPERFDLLADGVV